MQSLSIEPPNESNHTPRLPSQQPPPLPSSLSSLPEDIVLSCLARISKSYYPKLSLVSRSFRWLIRSNRLYKVRHQLKTQEECVYLGIQSPTNPCLIWYSLWIKPDHQTLIQCTIQDKSTGNLLARSPSSYSCHLPNMINTYEVGSEIYMIGGQKSPSSVVWVDNKLTGKRREVPSMMVARKEAFVRVLDGKIYVMGGCVAGESKYWGELFDPKTQTWEPLPDPGPEVRFSSNKKFIPMPGKIYVTTKKSVNSKKKNFVRSQQKKKKTFVYLVKENKWEVAAGDAEMSLLIDNMDYNYVDNKWWWYEIETDEWGLVNGLTELDAYNINDFEIGTCDEKLVIFWDSFASSLLDQTKNIWCAVIMLNKSVNGEVWGQIEWVDIVRTVPVSYTLARCETLLT